MWRWCICLLFLFPFILLPFLWTSFPTSCSNGHIHYAEGHEHDVDVAEPWHCHIPRQTGWACTPQYDCMSGGIYGPTNNGSVCLIIVFIVALGLFFYCTPHSHDIEYGVYDPRPVVYTQTPATRLTKKRAGLEAYPLR